MKKPTSTLHALNPINLTRTLCGAAEATAENYSANLELITCKRCLKAMAARAATEEWTETTMNGEPAKPAKEPKPAKPAKEPKPAKPATIHLHDSERSDHGTWCRIPGQHTTDPDAVTCKVCRAHIDGKAPLNAIPEQVKQARKAFRSFVARVAYMVFMDRDCGGINWSLSYTNMAGDCYEIGRSNTTGYRAMCNASIITTDLGQDIKQWMEDHWSCGEE